jgi:predicted nuclease of predicted toxin-antitoxin system
LRFIVEAQLPPKLAAWLQSRGLEANHVLDLSLAAETDDAIFQKAIKMDATIITKDSDFSRLLMAAPTCKVVWIRFGNATSGDLLLSLEPIWREIEEALEAGQRLVEVNK